MGVDFRIPGDKPDDDSIEHIHGWSYSGFHEFRERVAAAIGVRLDVMAGYRGEGLAMPWNVLRPHPLHALLNHSDCEGDLTPEECAAAFPELRRIAERWKATPPGDAVWSAHPYHAPRALALAALMEQAAKLGKPVRFC